MTQTAPQWYRLKLLRNDAPMATKPLDVLVHVRSDHDLAQQKTFHESRLHAAVVAIEPAKLHACAVCEKVGPWTPNWTWYHGVKMGAEQPRTVKVCSDGCFKAAKAAGMIPKDAPFLEGARSVPKPAVVTVRRPPPKPSAGSVPAKPAPKPRPPVPAEAEA